MKIYLQSDGTRGMDEEGKSSVDFGYMNGNNCAFSFWYDIAQKNTFRRFTWNNLLEESQRGEALKYCVYFIPDRDRIKIGKSQCMHSRLSSHRCSNSFIDVHSISIYPCFTEKQMSAAEKELHARFNVYRIDPRSEWFYFDKSILEFIESNCVPFLRSKQ